MIVIGGNGRHRLPAIAHFIARQRMLGARDRKDAEGLVAIGTGDNGAHARQLECPSNVDVDNFSVRIGTAVDAAGKLTWRENIGGVFGAPRYFLGPVDHGHIGTDIMRRDSFVHGAIPCAFSAAAYFTASMILT